MGSTLPLPSFLLMLVSDWVHCHQQIVIEFLYAENRPLQERPRGRRIRFTDAERVFLARKAKAAGRKALLELDAIVSPDTLLPWHRCIGRAEVELRRATRRWRSTAYCMPKSNVATILTANGVRHPQEISSTPSGAHFFPARGPNHRVTACAQPGRRDRSVAHRRSAPPA
jgi:hypothetical protein